MSEPTRHTVRSPSLGHRKALAGAAAYEQRATERANEKAALSQTQNPVEYLPTQGDN